MDQKKTRNCFNMDQKGNKWTYNETKMGKTEPKIDKTERKLDENESKLAKTEPKIEAK